MRPSLSLDKLSTAIVIINDDACAVYLNQAAIQLFGVSVRQIHQESFLELIKADFDLSNFTKLNQQDHTSFIEDTIVRTQTGFLSTNLMISRFSENNEMYFLLEFQSNEYHAHMRKDLELLQQSRVSNHLLRNLAHEIKNPLGGVKGAAQLLARKLPEDISNKYTQIIIDECHRLSELVDRMLLPAEPESEIEVNVHKLIEKAIEVITLQFSNFEIVKDYDPSLPNLFVSPSQIQQALLNILKNAAEAITADGEITIRTRILLQHTIGKQQHRQVIRIDIIDNGPGIDKDIAKDIFFPTISGKNSSGLGLSIAQSLVQRHGGIIELESRPSKTCFSIYLPLEQERADEHNEI